MTDFHTHILPCMDDGSGSIRESVSMLREETRQGIDTVVLTPHFYANENDIQTFLARRQQAWKHLIPFLPPRAPKLYLGAEVQYFDGISTAEDISLLRIQGSHLLLLEMPFCRWTDRMVEDVLELNDRAEIQVVLAHIERYEPMQPRTLWQELCSRGVLMQANVSFFTGWKTRYRAMSMLSRGEIRFLGSDCHNMTSRPPNWDRLPRKAAALAAENAAHVPSGNRKAPAGQYRSSRQRI